MKVQVSRPLSALSIAATIAFAAFAASAQTTPMMGGEMKGEDMMKGCDMMGGDMTRMMPMMHEKLSHAGDRVAALTADLKITEAQMPAWNKFADALLVAAKSMEKSMESMRRRREPSREARTPCENGRWTSQSLQAIKAALDPLYASLSDEQKEIADGLRIGPMGLM